MKKILLLLAAGVPLIASAQTDTTRTSTTLQDVTILGRKKTVKERHEFARHGQTTEVLTEAELNRGNSAFLEQGLGNMAGVQVDKRTQLGGQRIVIRGYGNDQKFNNWGIKVYYNGVPLTTADGITVMDDVDFSVVDNIEVVKGPAATMYGGGTGGVARFYLKPASAKGITLTEKFNAGSYNMLQSNTRLDVVTDNAAMALNYGHLQSDGYRPRGASLKNFYSWWGDFKLNSRQKINVYLSHNYSFDEISGQISYDDYYKGIDNGNAAYAKKNARNVMLSTRFAVTYDNQFAKTFSNRTSVFAMISDYRRVSAGADENSSNPNMGIRSVFSWKPVLKGRFANELNAGTEIQQSRSLLSSFRFTGTNDTIPLQVQGINSASNFRLVTNQASWFVQDRITYRPWGLSLLAGVSVNNINYHRTDLLAAPGLLTGYNKDLSFDKTYETSYNPHIALQKTWRNQIFNLSYSEGYNAPTSSSSFTSGINKVNDDLLPEKAKMTELSVQGLLFGTRFDYQVSVFNIDVTNKLTQLNGVNPAGGATYTYWANTGNQRNRGLEASLGYVWTLKNKALSLVEPFVTCSYYDFTYTDFKTKMGTGIQDYSGKQVVGVPALKYAAGLDLTSGYGFYMNNTFSYMGDVYTDFANTNKVKSFTQYNAKLGYRHSFSKLGLDLDVYAAGNNLTNQVNYTFLFLGNSINDSDAGSNYPKGVATDVNPGPSKAWYYGGFTLKYHL